MSKFKVGDKVVCLPRNKLPKIDQSDWPGAGYRPGKSFVVGRPGASISYSLGGQVFFPVIGDGVFERALELADKTTVDTEKVFKRLKAEVSGEPEA